jgi:hypothetical protein
MPYFLVLRKFKFDSCKGAHNFQIIKNMVAFGRKRKIVYFHPIIAPLFSTYEKDIVFSLLFSVRFIGNGPAIQTH